MFENDIIKLCNQYNIENYTINPDMTIDVDVDGDVNFFSKSLTNIPLNFGKVTGIFDCSFNKLTTLKGCPSYAGGDFNCQNNYLTTLNHLPMNFYIGDDFRCYVNNITSPTEYSRLFFGYIGGDIDTFSDNRFTALNTVLNKYKNPPKKDLPKILSELRKIQL